MNDKIVKRVIDLMRVEQLYDPEELFFRVHREFRNHYSTIREAIHIAKQKGI